MAKSNTSQSRRSFIKTSSLAGGGMILNFSWFIACKSDLESKATVSAKEWHELNGYLKIASNGQVTILSPNPEGGQNIKTSMPMIVAEELDVNWEDVIVEQAPLNTTLYQRQFIGGSNAIRYSWNTLRQAGATARHMLREAAARHWDIPTEEVTTEAGILKHMISNQSISYGEMASEAAKLTVPVDIKLKNKKSFRLIGSSQKNVDGLNIVTGKPLFGIDVHKEGMLIAMIVHPPAFGMRLKSMDSEAIASMSGIKEVFSIKVFEDDFERQHFDTCSFLEVVAIVGNSTWEVMKAKKAIVVEWEAFADYKEERTFLGQDRQTLTIPAGLENTDELSRKMQAAKSRQSAVVRRDGNPEKVFKAASKVLERTYTGPYLAHNCMEPMNFFADVKNGKAVLIGPLQKAELTEQTVSKRLGIPIDNIDIQMTRLGGGYGRRSYAHWVTEAALISQKVKAPVKLVYTREDDMTGGIYSPAYQATYRAAIDENNQLAAIHVNAGGTLDSPLYANRFPAGAVTHYLAESWRLNSNISIGSFRAPRSNFIACAEQSFLDEVAESIGVDPIDFRLDLLEKAKTNPVGESNDYDPDRMATVLKLARDKSNWGKTALGVHQGVSVYFCHNSYSAQVVDLRLQDDNPIVERVCCAVDCGIIVNPDAAANLAEGAIVDGVGNAFYGSMPFKNGIPQKTNFHQYRMIRMSESPKKIDIHFVDNGIDPTGLGEPTFPPVFGALANALYRATGKRYYNQPFLENIDIIG